MTPSSDFRWSGESLKRAVQESVDRAYEKFGLELESFKSWAVPVPTMFKWTFSGSSAGKPSFIEIVFRTVGQDDWLVTVTTSYGFSEKYTLPGNDETAFGRVRDCVNERLKEFKTNG